MSKNLFTIGLALVSFLLQGCNPATSEIVQSQIKTETPPPPQPTVNLLEQKNIVQL